MERERGRGKMVCEEQDLLDEGYGAVIYTISTAENNKEKQTRTLSMFAAGPL